MPSAGHLALYVALVGSWLAAIGFARPSALARGRTSWAAVAMVVAAACVVMATALLGWALVTSDFRLAYVADESHRGGSAPYRLAGLWGGMEGSLLVWVLALTATALAVRAWRRPPVAAVLLGLVAAFLAIVVWRADPFRVLAVPAIDGAGLTPILEHPAMLYHPLLVYAGLAATAAPFALTVAALASRRLDAVWLATCRRWALVAWVLLAVGMVAGAHWAYAELGWGGYWAWDPVENTALLPFLAITAFLHASRRDGSARLASGFALGGFLLAALGTMLTRSGAAPSVHAFAQDRTIGWALAALLLAIAAWATTLEIAFVSGLTAPKRTPERVGGLAWGLGVQVALVTCVLAVVLVGTLRPLVSDLTGGQQVAVAGRFFAMFTAPLAVALLAVVGYVTVPRRRWPIAIGVLVSLLVSLLAIAAGWRSPFTIGIAVTGAFAAAAAVGALVTTRRGGHLAHLGVALLLAGIAGSTTGHTLEQTLAVGESASVGGYEVRNDGAVVATAPDDPVKRVVATVTLRRGGHDLATFHPELAVFRERGVLLPQASLRSTPLDDVQVILRRADDDGRVLLVVHVSPLVQWVWWGGLLLAIGGALAIRAGDPREDRGPHGFDRAGGRWSPAARPPSPSPLPSPVPAAPTVAEVAPARAARAQVGPAPAPAASGQTIAATPPAP